MDAESPEPKPARKSLFLSKEEARVLRYFRRHWRALLFALACGSLAGLASTAPVPFLKKFGDEIFTHGDPAELRRLAIALVFLAAAGAAAQYGQVFVLRNVGYRVVQRVRSELVRAYQHLSLDFLQRQKAGDLTSRAIADSLVIQTSVTAVVDVVGEPLKLVALAVWAVILAPKLTLLFAVVVPLLVWSVRMISRAIRRYAKRTQTGMGTSAGLISESISGAREVRAFGLEEQQLARFEKEHEGVLANAVKGARATAAGPAIITVIGAVAGALVIVAGGDMVLNKEITPGALLGFLGAVGMAYDPIRKLSKTYNQLAQVAGAAERIFVILDQPSSVPDRGTRLAPPLVESVAFENVVFQYGDHRVIDGVSFEAKRGEVVALVGESGAGKTTLVSLLPRFWDVTAGSVKIDGVDARDFTIASLRARIALVGQETFLFNDTVRDNIRLGRLDATDAEIEAAAKAAYADAFIRKLPAGYDTMLGERGTGLSGGQRQRIAIARAILRGAPILLLDEATSSLDSESEEEVQKALEVLMRDRITFVVAHRLSTVTNADRIVVLSRGRIVEVGSHRDLYSSNGEYRRLHDLQFRTA